MFPADGSLERDAERAENARAVLDNPIYVESFGVLEQEMYKLWRESRDANDREQLHQFLLTLGKVQNALETVLRTGQVAREQLDRQRTKAEHMLGATFAER